MKAQDLARLVEEDHAAYHSNDSWKVCPAALCEETKKWLDVEEAAAAEQARLYPPTMERTPTFEVTLTHREAALARFALAAAQAEMEKNEKANHGWPGDVVYVDPHGFFDGEQIPTSEEFEQVGDEIAEFAGRKRKA